MLSAAIIMDPIDAINVEGDSNLAIMLAAQARNWRLDYLEKTDVWARDGKLYFNARAIEVFDNSQHWFKLAKPRIKQPSDYDVILLRLEPPVDTDFLHITHFLDLYKEAKPRILNPSDCLRDLNEKIFALHFADLMAPHLISSDFQQLMDFHKEQRATVLKPLDGSIGRGVFVLREHDMNLRSLIYSMTSDGRHPIMIQKYLPEVLKNGDRRVFIINGLPYEEMLIRIPHQGDFRSNLGAGGSYTVADLGKAEEAICARLMPVIKEREIFFAGLDIIDGRLSEINITCPTGLRQVARDGRKDPALHLIREIERLCASA